MDTIIIFFEYFENEGLLTRDVSSIIFKILFEIRIELIEKSLDLLLSSKFQISFSDSRKCTNVIKIHSPCLGIKNLCTPIFSGLKTIIREIATIYQPPFSLRTKSGSLNFIKINLECSDYVADLFFVRHRGNADFAMFLEECFMSRYFRLEDKEITERYLEHLTHQNLFIDFIW